MVTTEFNWNCGLHYYIFVWISVSVIINIWQNISNRVHALSTVCFKVYSHVAVLCQWNLLSQTDEQYNVPQFDGLSAHPLQCCIFASMFVLWFWYCCWQLFTTNMRNWPIRCDQEFVWNARTYTGCLPWPSKIYIKKNTVIQ